MISERSRVAILKEFADKIFYLFTIKKKVKLEAFAKRYCVSYAYCESKKATKELN